MQYSQWNRILKLPCPYVNCSLNFLSIPVAVKRGGGKGRRYGYRHISNGVIVTSFAGSVLMGGSSHLA
jgi:hypothetical protein